MMPYCVFIKKLLNKENFVKLNITHKKQKRNSFI